MDLKDLVADAGHIPTEKFERRLNRLVRENHRFKNLDKNNRKTVLELVKKHKSRLREKGGLSADTIRKEMHSLHRNRLKLDLSDADLKDIKEILEGFKK